MESDGMLDWSARECKDYKDRATATVACACPDSSAKQSDTWEWRGPCCLVRVHRQTRRCLYTLSGRRAFGTDSPASEDYPCQAPRSLFLESCHGERQVCGSTSLQKSCLSMDRRNRFKVAPDPCGKSVLRTSARILVPVSDMNPMAIADSGASHVILPQTALYDTKSAKPVNLWLAAGIQKKEGFTRTPPNRYGPSSSLSKQVRKIWTSIKFLSAKFGFTPPPHRKTAQNEENVQHRYKIHKIPTFPGGGGEPQFYGQTILWTSGLL